MTFGTTQDPHPDQVLHQPTVHQATVHQATVHRFSRKRFIAIWVTAAIAAVIAVAAAFLATLPRAQSNAVINGPLVSTAPSWVAILARGDAAGNVQWCGGVLISANLLLSARHCQTEKNPNTAIIGAADLNKSGGAYAKIQAFEGYSGTDDLAVYQLDSPVSQPYILLSDTDIHLSPELVTLYGYGINTEFTDPKPTSDFRLHSVDGISGPCDEEDEDLATASEFCLESSEDTQAPCGADSGAPLVNRSGKLGAIYVGIWTPPDDPRCLGSLWRAISVTTPPVQKWIADMISKYAVNDEL